ncbi:MAG: DNA polymerase II large subunit [Candidatus Diapherotrites archaeon]|nr:DNA polymerase II large subunit [Candidatus Diapherotrites archaeon]
MNAQQNSAGIIAEPFMQEYFARLQTAAQTQFEQATLARRKGMDPETFVECKPTLDLADRTEQIIGPPGIAKRFRELSAEQPDRIRVIFELFRELIEQKWHAQPDPQKRLEHAVKTCLMLLTEGVVVAPLDGVPSIKISENFDGTKYVDFYFAGPIRAAGGTATVFPLILGDYARQLMKLDRFKPTEDEIERYVEECNIYDEIVTRQYKLTDDEVRKIIRGCPVCINGEPTEEREVVSHKNLSRVPSNRVRGGACLVISEGVGLKARKILSLVKILKLDWAWVEDLIKVEKGGSEGESLRPSFNYLKKLAAGRPILSYPSQSGGFRLRYGKGRNTSVMAKAIHPATMQLLDDFLAVGTQIKIERPGKSAEIFPCDSIEGPTVLLHSGEVRAIQTKAQAQSIQEEVRQILFLGDILITLGDFQKSGHPLMPPGYCPEWWEQEFEKAIREKNKHLPKPTDAYSAVELSRQLNIPLHPDFTAYWDCIEKNELMHLHTMTKTAQTKTENNQITECRLPNSPQTKSALEHLGLPHHLETESIVIGKPWAYPFLFCLGFFSTQSLPTREKNTQALSELCGIPLRDKGGTFIGCRMGRPEQAKPRKMIGNPHVLFPIGLAGGATRSINKASESEKTTQQKIESGIGLFRCENCQTIRSSPQCEVCHARTTPIRRCPKGHYTAFTQETCPTCKEKTVPYSKRPVELSLHLTQALAQLKMPLPEILKGVKGLISDEKIPEPLSKGLLRAKHNLHIFRDGTVRFELLNAVLTHFKPGEIKLSVTKARELGYHTDIHGKPLKNENQTLALFPQDIIIHEGAGEFFLRVSRFCDELLEKVYGIPPCFNQQTPADLIGELTLSLAPHTSAAVVGRLIGYTKGRVCFAHPFFHLCKRSNCLEKNTPILIEQNGQTKIIPIGELDSKEKTMQIPLQNTFAFSADRNGKIHKEKITALHKEKSPAKLFTLKTVFGREITATKDHQMLTFNGKKVVEKKVETLRKGDSLISLRKISFGKKEKENLCLKLSAEFPGKKINAKPVKTKENLLPFLGRMVS